MSERWYWVMGAISFQFALGGAIQRDRTLFVIAGAATTLFFWGAWRFGKRR